MGYTQVLISVVAAKNFKVVPMKIPNFVFQRNRVPIAIQVYSCRFQQCLFVRRLDFVTFLRKMQDILKKKLMYKCKYSIPPSNRNVLSTQMADFATHICGIPIIHFCTNYPSPGLMLGGDLHLPWFAMFY